MAARVFNSDAPSWGRLGSNSTIDSLNPFVAFNGDAYTTFEYIYPYLVQFNPKLQFIADFAPNHEINSAFFQGLLRLHRYRRPRLNLQ